MRRSQIACAGKGMDLVRRFVDGGRHYFAVHGFRKKWSLDLLDSSYSNSACRWNLLHHVVERPCN